MKKFLLMLGAVALMTACGDNLISSGTSGGGQLDIDLEKGYKYLSNLNVSDAKMIYQKKTSDTGMKSRAAGYEDGIYYKIDLNGDEVRLIIKGEDGLAHDIGIRKIVKLSDKFLLVDPSAQDIIDLIYTPAPGDPGVDFVTTTSCGPYLSLVDVATEKIYKFPKDIFINLYDYNGGGFESVSDSQGNIYFASTWSEYSQYDQIYKLDTKDFTIRPMLPDKVTCSGFEVTEDGFIVYWSGHERPENCRIKCPGGRIYPIADFFTFLFNGSLYSVREQENAIIKYETVGDNNIEEKEICQIPEGTVSCGYMYFTPNRVRNTLLINNVCEFDGETCVELETPVRIGDIVTSKAWYTRNGIKLSKTAMADYRTSEFEVKDYDIQTLSASPESPNLTFTGYRYSDGVSVLGTIDENDQVSIDNETDKGEEIFDLIPLN